MANREPFYHEKALLPTDRVRWTEIALGIYALTGATVIASADGTLIAALDEITSAQVNIPVVHHEVHEGEFYSVSYKAPDGAPLADDATITLAMMSPTRYLHFQAFGALGGDAEMEFYTGSTIAADGTLMVPNNHNIEKAMASTAVVRRDPTVTVAGVLRDNFLVPGGTGGASVGGDGGQRDEWVIPPNTWAFARITNRAGNAQPGSLKTTWYEESTN